MNFFEELTSIVDSKNGQEFYEFDEDAIRDLTQSDLVDWMEARLIGSQNDGFDRPGDRWNYEHEASLFFHLAKRFSNYRNHRINYPEFSGIVYEASADFLEKFSRGEIGFHNLDALSFELATTTHTIENPEKARDLVSRFAEIVLSEKFAWWHEGSSSWIIGRSETTTQTELELNIQEFLHQTLVSLQAQVGERGSRPDLVEHFWKYEARTRTHQFAFFGKLAFCGSLPGKDWLKENSPFYHYYRMYARSPERRKARNLCADLRQGYTFPHLDQEKEDLNEAVKRLAHEVKKVSFRRDILRRDWSSQDIWEEIRSGLEEDLSIYNHEKDKSLTWKEFWPMPEKLEDVEDF